MSWILPLPAVLPLLAAALNGATDHMTPKWVHTAITFAGIGAATVFSSLVLWHALPSETLHWFGGWTPRGGVALGISFAADPLGAGMAVFACALTLMALVYSVTFISAEKRNYDILVSGICGAVCGFALSGDLFNMFVWLELVGVAAYAVTGFDIRRMSALQGSVNFAVVNTIGGYLVLIGIALVYARTGALNLAQIGRTLAGEPSSGLLIVSMTLIFCGFLCKAAVVPFHFWLADAYAVAPAPVCALFAGVVTDIGVFGVARVWFTVFDAPFGSHQRLVGDALLWIGIVTAIVGALMALLQQHLKRLLAFSVICHIGIILAGVALLSTKGVAGAALMLLAHGLATAGLFCAAGILATREQTRWTAFLWFGGALALIGPPYLGVYMGHSLIDDAAWQLGRQWVQPLLWASGAVVGAALIRAGLQVFLGLGNEQEHGIDERRDASVPVLGVVSALLVAAGLAISLVPGLPQRVEYGADRFRARAEYANRVLHGAAMQRTAHLPVAYEHSAPGTLLYSGGALVLAIALAAFAVWFPRASPTRLFEPALAGLERLQTGLIGDYVMWVVVGVAVLGGVWALTLR